MTSDQVPAEQDQAFLSALGRLIGRELEREPGQYRSLEDSVLGRWKGQQVVNLEIHLGVTEYTAVALSFTDEVQAMPAERVQGSRSEHPVWGLLETPEGNLPYPLSVALHLTETDGTGFECLVNLLHQSQVGFGDGSSLRVSVASKDADAARAWVAQRRQHAAAHHDPLRGRVVELYFTGGDIYPRIVEPPRPERDVIVDAAVTAEIDRNVISHLAANDILARSGLGCNRGILLYGPPGTGKTSLVRDIIATTNGKATVLVPASGVAAEALGHIYRDAVRLSPSVVVLEDVDAIAGRRGTRLNNDLAGFLNALDGVIKDEKSLVITVATTNDPSGIDEAAKRPGRIDKFIEVPLPNQLKREKILSSYLQRITAEGIACRASQQLVADIAKASEGASGALLKEVVRRALLLAHRENDGAIGDTELAEAAKEIGYRVSTGSGQYL